MSYKPTSWKCLTCVPTRITKSDARFQFVHMLLGDYRSSTHLQARRVGLVATECLLCVAQLRLQRGDLSLQRLQPRLHAGTARSGRHTDITLRYGRDCFGAHPALAKMCPTVHDSRLAALCVQLPGQTGCLALCRASSLI